MEVPGGWLGPGRSKLSRGGVEDGLNGRMVCCRSWRAVMDVVVTDM